MWGTALFAVIYYLLLSIQGLDYADEGFSLTFYQNIYTHPEDVSYLFLYYLTGLIGGVWEMLFAYLGNYGYRILFSLFAGGIVLTTFAILRPHFRTSTIVLSTVACVMWPGLCLYYFNHDCLTILLFLLTVLCMMHGLNGKRWAWWLMGVLLTLNTSARLPNITLSILILVPFIEANYSGNYYNAGINFLRIIGGTILGSAAMIAIMSLLNHTWVWLSSVNALFIMSGDTSDTHSLSNMLHSYAYTYKGIFTTTIYGVIASILFVVATQRIKLKGITLIMSAITIAFFYAILTRNIYAMWGGLTAATIIYGFIHKRNSNLFILGFASFTMLMVIPFGGDSYANICNSCLWLGMPMLIELCRRPLRWNISFSDNYERNYEIKIDNTTSRQLGICGGVAFIIFVALHSVCYFDDGSRLEKTHRPDLVATTTYTSQERAEMTEQIVKATQQHRMPGNYLLVFDNAPMLHYLTGMQPYLGSPWSTFWGNKMFEERLKRSENSARDLPLIAIPRFYYRDLSPTNYLDPVEHPEMHKKAEILFRFINRYGYQVVYVDDYITLYGVVM